MGPNAPDIWDHLRSLNGYVGELERRCRCEDPTARLDAALELSMIGSLLQGISRPTPAPPEHNPIWAEIDRIIAAQIQLHQGHGQHQLIETWIQIRRQFHKVRMRKSPQDMGVLGARSLEAS